MFKHLLVPIDGSDLSGRAVDAGIALARTLGARITGFIAEPMAPLPHMGSNLVQYTRETEAHERRTEAHAQATLKRFGEQARGQGVGFEGRYTRADDVGEAIARAAEEFGCDLVVMATHGRGAFGELLFGSHTKNVMSKTRLPLLVLH
jgi:nucleotide-binding universal stress UspA family protein